MVTVSRRIQQLGAYASPEKAVSTTSRVSPRHNNAGQTGRYNTPHPLHGEGKELSAVRRSRGFHRLDPRRRHPLGPLSSCGAIPACAGSPAGRPAPGNVCSWPRREITKIREMRDLHGPRSTGAASASALACSAAALPPWPAAARGVMTRWLRRYCTANSECHPGARQRGLLAFWVRACRAASEERCLCCPRVRNKEKRVPQKQRRPGSLACVLTQ